jgi:hypothetical protein
MEQWYLGWVINIKKVSVMSPGGGGRGGARHKGVFSTPKPKRWIHEDAADLDKAVISKALLKFEDLDEAVIGVEEVVFEVEAMETGTRPVEVEEYRKFVYRLRDECSRNVTSR